MARDTPPGPFSVHGFGRDDRKRSEIPRPKTWQVITGFMTAASILVGGAWAVATMQFVDKETYLKDRAADAVSRAHMTAELTAAREATQTLQKAAERLSAKIDALDERTLHRAARRRRRRRKRKNE